MCKPLARAPPAAQHLPALGPQLPAAAPRTARRQPPVPPAATRPVPACRASSTAPRSKAPAIKRTWTAGCRRLRSKGRAEVFCGCCALTAAPAMPGSAAGSTCVVCSRGESRDSLPGDLGAANVPATLPPRAPSTSSCLTAGLGWEHSGGRATLNMSFTRPAVSSTHLQSTRTRRCPGLSGAGCTALLLRCCCVGGGTVSCAAGGGPYALQASCRS